MQGREVGVLIPLPRLLIYTGGEGQPRHHSGIGEVHAADVLVVVVHAWQGRAGEVDPGIVRAPAVGFQPDRLRAGVVVTVALQVGGGRDDEARYCQPPVTKAAAGTLQIAPEELRAVVAKVGVEASTGRDAGPDVRQLVEVAGLQIQHPKVVEVTTPWAGARVPHCAGVGRLLSLEDQVAAVRVHLGLPLVLVG
ncbi:MAG: hypothetical protein FJZ89_07920 [Chloroflexi bacterium]|nr:hypothetical protein [Chloroflexota bacterium]